MNEINSLSVAAWIGGSYFTQAGATRASGAETVPSGDLDGLSLQVEGVGPQPYVAETSSKIKRKVKQSVTQENRVVAKSFGPKPYKALIKALVKAGVSKVMIGEDHRDSQPARVTGLTVNATKRALKGEPVTIYREVAAGIPVSDVREGEKICKRGGMTSGGSRVVDLCAEEVVRAYVHEMAGATAPSPSDQKGLVNALLKGVKFKFMYFNDPNQSDMKRFIKDKSVAIASLGGAHATATLNWDDIVRSLCCRNRKASPSFAKVLQRAPWKHRPFDV